MAFNFSSLLWIVSGARADKTKNRENNLVKHMRSVNHLHLLSLSLNIFYCRINWKWLQGEHETNMKQTIGSERKHECLFSSSVPHFTVSRSHLDTQQIEKETASSSLSWTTWYTILYECFSPTMRCLCGMIRWTNICRMITDGICFMPLAEILKFCVMSCCQHFMNMLVIQMNRMKWSKAHAVSAIQHQSCSSMHNS